MTIRLLLALLPLMLAACTHVVVLPPDADDYTATAYAPRHAHGFALRALPDDSTALALETYRPDTLRLAIPRGGFRRVVCMSSTYVGTLAELGVDSVIVGVSSPQYLTNRAVAERAADVGYDGAINYEAILAAKPDLALIYGIGGESPLAAKLTELAIPYVYINEFEEQSPLGRAEWAVALGALVGTDGRELFGAVERAYRPAEAAEPVAVMLNAPYSGNWFIPGRENYLSRLLADAGARICAPQPQGVESRPIDLEEALPALERASLWLFPGQATTLGEVGMLAPKAKFSGPVWNQTGDFYETGASRPDVVVSELQAVVGGTAPDSLRYFRRLR